MHSRLIFMVVLVISGINVHCYQYEDNFYDAIAKPIADPKELIKYIRREKLGRLSQLRRGFHKKIHAKAPPNIAVKCSTEETVSIDEEDKEILNLRKIWSRWGKWSPCSVTCGDGVTTRRRLCVIGRCAPGEIEEQRRPCSRTPCFPAPGCTEDQRESD